MASKAPAPLQSASNSTTLSKSSHKKAQTHKIDLHIFLCLLCLFVASFFTRITETLLNIHDKFMTPFLIRTKLLSGDCNGEYRWWSTVRR